MRKSGRLLATIALIALLLSPALPTEAEPVASRSWRDVLHHVENWVGRLIAPVMGPPLADANDREDPDEDAQLDDVVVLLQRDVQSVREHNEVFPGMDPDG